MVRLCALPFICGWLMTYLSVVSGFINPVNNRISKPMSSLRISSGNNNNNNSNNNNGGDFEDPNPGGMSEWGKNDDNNNNNNEDENLLDQLRSWIRSDEGREDVQTYTVSLAVALLLRFLIIEPRYIPSLSMFPTFDVGDQLAVEKVTKRIKPFYRNEVVVFNPPNTFREIMSSNYGVESRKSKEALIKRIVAIEVRTYTHAYCTHTFETCLLDSLS